MTGFRLERVGNGQRGHMRPSIPIERGSNYPEAVSEWLGTDSRIMTGSVDAAVR